MTVFENNNSFRIGLILLGVGLIATASIFIIYPETFENHQHHQVTEIVVEENKEEDEAEGGSSEGSEDNKVIDELNERTTQNRNELELVSSPPPEIRVDIHEFEHEAEPEPELSSVEPITQELLRSLDDDSQVTFADDDMATF